MKKDGLYTVCVLETIYTHDEEDGMPLAYNGVKGFLAKRIYPRNHILSGDFDFKILNTKFEGIRDKSMFEANDLKVLSKKIRHDLYAGFYNHSLDEFLFGHDYEDFLKRKTMAARTKLMINKKKNAYQYTISTYDFNVSHKFLALPKTFYKNKDRVSTKIWNLQKNREIEVMKDLGENKFEIKNKNIKGVFYDTILQGFMEDLYIV